jgi:hypothetical protein
MMEWILLSGFNTAALLVIELGDFIRDRWPRRRPGTRPGRSPVAGPGAGARSSPQPDEWPSVTADSWQTTARRLAGQWTVLDGLSSHDDAHIQHAPAATAMRRTLSPDQILSARISAAYAVWSAARESWI